ncbi:hypothetical protein AMTR_s00060p00189450 [Amborella trichopoda]|uniref:Uncharacterized protein n=1 Tax=Amborella trichopoda TaxID=13333 RepID=W1NJH4_AMBTC|nr:hypothetical protein AMTR_s00060p00189450 [Amborella trichopoda]
MGSPFLVFLQRLLVPMRVSVMMLIDMPFSMIKEWGKDEIRLGSCRAGRHGGPSALELEDLDIMKVAAPELEGSEVLKPIALDIRVSEVLELATEALVEEEMLHETEATSPADDIAVDTLTCWERIARVIE